MDDMDAMDESKQEYATRSAILRPIERRYREAEIDGLGRIRIQSLSAREMDDYEFRSINRKTGRLDPAKAAEARRRLIALCLVDEHGKRMFSDHDLAAMGNIDGQIADQIYAACEEHVKGSTVEEAEKN